MFFYTELCLNEKLLKQSNSQLDKSPSLVKIEHFLKGDWRYRWCQE